MTDSPLDLPALQGARLHLRRWWPADAPAIQEASHDPLIPSITSVPTTDGVPEALAFIDRQHDRLRKRVGYPFAIANADDLAVGHIGLFFSSGAGARASVGYWVAPSQRRKGYAAEALSVMTAWARNHDDLDRLELHVEPRNDGSWRASEHADYKREGLLRAWERGSRPVECWRT